MEKQQTEFLNYVKLRGIAGQSETQQFGDKTLVSFSLMTETAHRSKDANTIEITWLPVRCWNPSEDPIPNIIKNQSVIEVEGRLRMKRYTRPSGEKILSYEVSAQKMTILGTAGNLIAKQQSAE